jgi:SAM-dependent methyltransferase
MRIATVDELLQLLDTLHEQRADATSRAASEHWGSILQSEGHPLNTDLPDVNLIAWHEAAFDFVYDSGCFHHLAPHRRISYLRSLEAALAPGGYFGICTFTAGLMGSDAPDDVLMRSGYLGEGVGYTEAELVQMFFGLELVDAGPMLEQRTVTEPAFSQNFLTVALFRRPRAADRVVIGLGHA